MDISAGISRLKPIAIRLREALIALAEAAGKYPADAFFCEFGPPYSTHMTTLKKPIPKESLGATDTDFKRLILAADSLALQACAGKFANFHILKAKQYLENAAEELLQSSDKPEAVAACRFWQRITRHHDQETE